MRVSLTELELPKKQLYLPLFPLGLLSIILLYNLPLLTMKRLAAGGDGLTLFYPAEYLLARSLRDGTLPFWITEIQCGFPLLADGQPGALYPINILMFGLLPTPIAHNWVILFHSLLGFLFTYYWGRTLGMSPTAAGWSGFLFTITTPLVGNNTPLLETLAWSPALFLFTERLVRNRTPRQILSVSLTVAFQWLAGFPQVAFYSLVATFVYLILRSVSEHLPKKSWGHLLLAWGIGCLLGLAMSAPQLLPTYELSQHSIRAGGIQGSMAGERSLFPAALITYLLPSWRPFFSETGLGGTEYIGLLPLLLATLPLLVRTHTRWVSAIIGMSVTALLLAFGRYTPLFLILQHLPGFSSFRVPSRFLFLTQLGLAMLAGLGWELFFGSARQPAITRWIRRGLTLATLLLLLNVAIAHPLLEILQTPIMRILRSVATRMAADPYHVQPWSYYETKIARTYELLLAATSWRHYSFLLSLAVLSGAILCWKIDTLKPHRRAWIRWAWGSLIAVDLLTFAGWMRTGLPPSVIMHPPPSVKAIRLDAPLSPYRVFWVVDQGAVTPDPEDMDLLPANFNALFGLSSTGLYSPLGFYNYYRLLEKVGTVNLAFGLRPVTPNVVYAQRSLLNLLNVHYILSRKPLEGFPLVARERAVRVYRNPNPLPRAFVVDEVSVVSSNEEAIRRIREDAGQVRACAILEEPLPFSLTPGAASASTVAIESYTPTKVQIRVVASGNVLLVLTDTSYPGWEAELDGNLTSIYRANGAFRAVLIPSGAHRVTFAYDPHSFRAGVLIAAIGVVSAGVLILLPYILPLPTSARPEKEN